jgi:hypothetical protein
MIDFAELTGRELPDIAPSDGRATYTFSSFPLEFRNQELLYGATVTARAPSATHTSYTIASGFSPQLLLTLLKGDCVALRIPKFCPEGVARALAQEIVTSTARQNYHHEVKNPDGSIKELLDYNVDRVGPVRNRLFGPDTRREHWLEYSQEGRALMERFRQIAAPHGSHPVDTLMSALSAAWPYGAGFDFVAPGIEAYAGVGRFTRPGLKTRLSEEPHKDSLPEHIAYPVQLGINVYLSVPERGGELVVWDEQDGRATTKVWEIRPRLGDLIIVRTSNFHSVNGFDSADRTTISCFGGMRHDGPIRLWS